ncbi:hypothetical protein PCL_06803 [Purpureocillium lilacinum]|uniref:Uncharacterized protein n=1 Tax=Purpureocillium lilacinum TaxID=33203 RepID=A0A2U3DTL4_PURLI|nr:hypothetical protein Purlil1_9580 [Purpureocillium lilacinum]PWI65598.1 hypothetical protein PCL_06803 [Purpureocillium lilacinum]
MPSSNEVKTGEFRGCRAGQGRLETRDLGTCVGVVVTGEPHNGGETRFLFHLSLGQGWSDICRWWSEFVEAVERSGMRDMKGYMFTVDTTLNKDPDFKHNAYMMAEADSLKATYRGIKGKLQDLVGRGTVVLETHSFRRVGHMEVDENNVVRVDGRRISE